MLFPTQLIDCIFHCCMYEYSPCAWSWCDGDPELELQYQQLVTNIRELTARYPGVRNKFFLYNKSTLHCTIATLFSFKDETSPISDSHRNDEKQQQQQQQYQRRSRVFEVWSQVLADHLSHPTAAATAAITLELQDQGNSSSSVTAAAAVSSSHSFPLEVSRIEVGKSACVFHLTDINSRLTMLRCLVRAAAEDCRLRAAEVELGLPYYGLSQYISIPDIVHSTFARYDHVSFRSDEEQMKFKAELEAICGSWQPRRVAAVTESSASSSSSSFYLVHEYHPYMQMPKQQQQQQQRLVQARRGDSGAAAADTGGEVGTGTGVVTSPIIATFSMKDVVAAIACASASATSDPEAQAVNILSPERRKDTASNRGNSDSMRTPPCASSGSGSGGKSVTSNNDNELTLTPLSPLYHMYIHPEEEMNGAGDDGPSLHTPHKPPDNAHKHKNGQGQDHQGSNSTPTTSNSILHSAGGESELFLTPLSDQLGSSTAGSAVTATATGTAGRGGSDTGATNTNTTGLNLRSQEWSLDSKENDNYNTDDEEEGSDGSHLLRSLVTDSSLFSPAVGFASPVGAGVAAETRSKGRYKSGVKIARTTMISSSSSSVQHAVHQVSVPVPAPVRTSTADIADTMVAVVVDGTLKETTAVDTGTELLNPSPPQAAAATAPATAGLPAATTCSSSSSGHGAGAGAGGRCGWWATAGVTMSLALGGAAAAAVYGHIYHPRASRELLQSWLERMATLYQTASVTCRGVADRLMLQLQQQLQQLQQQLPPRSLPYLSSSQQQ